MYLLFVLTQALSATDIEQSIRAGRIASLMGVEGGHSINSSLSVLRMFYRLGVRYMTLTHNCHTSWADSWISPPLHNGLTVFGREVVLEMNRMGMLVDLSHVSVQVMTDTLDTVRSPVIFSHSGARDICSHPRNVPDSILQRLPANGGVVLVNFYPVFVSERVYNYSQSIKDREDADQLMLEWYAHAENRIGVAEVADHIEHIRNVSGIAHVGLGSDFDGISILPDGLASVADCKFACIQIIINKYKKYNAKSQPAETLLQQRA